MTTERADVGTAAEEAAKLLAALRGWVDNHLATGDAQCQACPFCQMIMALRESRPEVAQHLTTAGLSFAAAVRALFDGATVNRDQDDGSDVVHIDIDGDEG